jgi:hypothetical protein
MIRVQIWHLWLCIQLELVKEQILAKSVKAQRLIPLLGSQLFAKLLAVVARRSA